MRNRKSDEALGEEIVREAQFPGTAVPHSVIEDLDFEDGVARAREFQIELDRGLESYEIVGKLSGVVELVFSEPDIVRVVDDASNDIGPAGPVRTLRIRGGQLRYFTTTNTAWYPSGEGYSIEKPTSVVVNGRKCSSAVPGVGIRRVIVTSEAGKRTSRPKRVAAPDESTSRSAPKPKKTGLLSAVANWFKG